MNSNRSLSTIQNCHSGEILWKINAKIIPSQNNRKNHVYAMSLDKTYIQSWAYNENLTSVDIIFQINISDLSEIRNDDL